MTRIGIDARKLADFGIGTYLLGLLAELDRQPGDEQFVLFTYPDAPLPELGGRFAAVPVGAAGYSLKEHWELPWAARRARVALYHSPHYVLPFALRTPAVVTIHDLIHLRFPEHLGRRGGALAARLLLRNAARRARRILTVSQASKNDIVEYLRVPPGRVVVVPNAVAPAFFAEDIDTEATAARWGLTDPFILYVGNIKPHKNLPRLLEAFARLAGTPAGHGMSLVLAGPAEADAAAAPLLARAAELGLSRSLRLLGRVPGPELPGLYRLARVVAMPSLCEGFGLPVLEAMAAGTPVVTSDLSSLPEVAGDAALLVDPLSVDQLAEALAKLVQDAKLRRTLIDRGRAQAMRTSWGDAARTVLATYREVLAAESAGPIAGERMAPPPP